MRAPVPPLAAAPDCARGRRGHQGVEAVRATVLRSRVRYRRPRTESYKWANWLVLFPIAGQLVRPNGSLSRFDRRRWLASLVDERLDLRGDAVEHIVQRRYPLA